MVLFVADTRFVKAADFDIYVIRPYRLPSGLPEQGAIARGIMAAIADTAETCRPAEITSALDPGGHRSL